MLIPLRKLQHNPVKILAPYIKPGMKAMDFGPAMGYFSIPLAKLTGTKGKVYCVDIQEKMLEKLKQRAVKYGVNTIIDTQLVGKGYDPSELKDQLDFVLLFFVVHEIPDKVTLFRDIRSMVKKGGKVLFAEPKGHVSEADFNRSLDIARQAGFTVTDEKPVKRGWSAMLV
jgi:2-polyprenyl-3-methyl-5-hydroxy-6-metoxy-1,4-benzoquinol methylase